MKPRSSRSIRPKSHKTVASEEAPKTVPAGPIHSPSAHAKTLIDTRGMSKADAAWWRETHKIAKSSSDAAKRRKHLEPVRSFLGKDIVGAVDRQFQGDTMGVHHSDAAIVMGIAGTAATLGLLFYFVSRKPTAPSHTAGEDEAPPKRKRTFWEVIRGENKP